MAQFVKLVSFTPKLNAAVMAKVKRNATKSSWFAMTLPTPSFKSPDSVKLDIALLSKAESRHELHARAGDETPVMYSRTKFQPITKAHSSPMVT